MQIIILYLVDISKLLHKLEKSPEECKKALLGDYYNSHFQERQTMPFTCNPEDYYRVISPHILISNFDSFFKFINDFISSCLMLGCFLKEINEYESINYICTSESLWRNYCFDGKRDGVHVRIRTIEKEMVEIIMTDDTARFNKSYTEITLNNVVRMNSLLAYGDYFYPNIIMRPIPQAYQIDIKFKKLILPPFGKLPLYVNVPYMKTYARDMFKNPPPPPPRIEFNKPLFDWI